MELLDMINKKGAENRNAEVAKLIGKRDNALMLLNTVEMLGPRISYLWNVCQALLNNGFVLGKETRSNMGFDYPEFETDGIFHRIGFKVVGRRFGSVTGGTIICFGIKGGGCDGEDFFVNKDGVWGTTKWMAAGDCKFVEGNIDKVYHYYNGYLNVPLYTINSFTNKIQSVINGFEDFEQRVLDYAESVVK
jgi:hypothetical protein